MSDNGRTDTPSETPRSLSSPPTTADALELAMEAERHDLAADSPARTVLVSQVGLIQSQMRLADVQIASERAGLLLKVAGGLAAIVAAVLLGVFVWDARHASGLVIEPFSVPPALAEQGQTGEVIAAEVQDRITAMQAQTSSARAEASFETNWGEDISVEIPQTGVSVGELQAWLRGWLGRQTRVGGAVTRTAEGLRVTARVAGQPADVATGDVADLDGTVARAAEALFARTQPYRYGVWLAQNGRYDEAKVFFERQFTVAKGDELAWALIGRGYIEPLPVLSAGFLERALAVNPNLGLAQSNLATVYIQSGRRERALASDRATIRTLRRRDVGATTPESAAALAAQSGFQIAVASKDGDAALRFADQTAALPDYFGSRSRAPALQAEALSLLHDGAGARAAIGTMGQDDATILRATASTMPQAPYLALAIDEERWSDAASTLEPLRTLLIDMTGIDPWLFPSFAASSARVFIGVGRPDEAQALIANTPLDCFDCVLARAWLAESRGDRTRADHWFGEAVRIGPSLAAAPLAFGRARLARGDTQGALAQFREANRRAPHWADPLKFWGDALLAQGEEVGAKRKYEAAAEIAPRWGALRLAWGRALAAEGRTAQAQAQWRVAAGLELSPTDRAEVTRRLPSARPSST